MWKSLLTASYNCRTRVVASPGIFHVTSLVYEVRAFVALRRETESASKWENFVDRFSYLRLTCSQGNFGADYFAIGKKLAFFIIIVLIIIITYRDKFLIFHTLTSDALAENSMLIIICVWFLIYKCNLRDNIVLAQGCHCLRVFVYFGWRIFSTKCADGITRTDIVRNRFADSALYITILIGKI